MDNTELRYAQLNALDADMQQLDEREDFLSAQHMRVSHAGTASDQPNQVR